MADVVAGSDGEPGPAAGGPPYLYEAEVVRDYVDPEEGEHTLRLITGERIFVCETDEESSWWGGYRTCNPDFCGWFPSPYVKKIPGSEQIQEELEVVPDDHVELVLEANPGPTGHEKEVIAMKAEEEQVVASGEDATVKPGTTSKKGSPDSTVAESLSCSTKEEDHSASVASPGSRRTSKESSVNVASTAGGGVGSTSGASSLVGAGGSTTSSSLRGVGGGIASALTSKQSTTANSTTLSGSSCGPTGAVTGPSSATAASTAGTAAMATGGPSPMKKNKSVLDRWRHGANAPPPEPEKETSEEVGAKQEDDKTGTGSDVITEKKEVETVTTGRSKTTREATPAAPAALVENTTVDLLEGTLSKTGASISSPGASLADTPPKRNYGRFVPRVRPTATREGENNDTSSSKTIGMGSGNTDNVRTRRVESAFADVLDHKKEQREAADREIEQEKLQQVRMSHDIRILKEQVEDLKKELDRKDTQLSQLQTDKRRLGDDGDRKRDGLLKFIEAKLGEKLSTAQIEAVESGDVDAKNIPNTKGLGNKQFFASSPGDESRSSIEAPLKREVKKLQEEVETQKRKLEEATLKAERLETDCAQKESDKEYLNHLLDESYRLWKVDNSERGKWVQKYYDRYIELEGMLINSDTEEGVRRINAIRPLLLEKREKRAAAKEKKKNSTSTSGPDKMQSLHSSIGLGSTTSTRPRRSDIVASMPEPPISARGGQPPLSATRSVPAKTTGNNSQSHHQLSASLSASRSNGVHRSISTSSNCMTPQPAPSRSARTPASAMQNKNRAPVALTINLSGIQHGGGDSGPSSSGTSGVGGSLLIVPSATDGTSAGDGNSTSGAGVAPLSARGPVPDSARWGDTPAARRKRREELLERSSQMLEGASKQTPRPSVDLSSSRRVISGLHRELSCTSNSGATAGSGVLTHTSSIASSGAASTTSRRLSGGPTTKGLGAEWTPSTRPAPVRKPTGVMLPGAGILGGTTGGADSTQQQEFEPTFVSSPTINDLTSNKNERRSSIKDRMQAFER
ncbi:unnamed protein product [Amoebophrya sp. A25]|nr:unnamed protein product [Amoebophrya sp. A25]|eukprot:GSA25T00000584001.1